MNYTVRLRANIGQQSLVVIYLANPRKRRFHYRAVKKKEKIRFLPGISLISPLYLPDFAPVSP